MRALICLFIFFSLALLVAPISVFGAVGLMGAAVGVALIDEPIFTREPERQTPSTQVAVTE